MVNTGLHFSETYENDVKALVHYWHQAKGELPFFVWKDTPTQHFDQVRTSCSLLQHQAGADIHATRR